MDYEVHRILQARILEWVAIPFSWGSSQPRDWTQVSLRRILYQLSHKGSPRILEWVAYPFSRASSEPGIEPQSPALQVGSLPTELSGKSNSKKRSFATEDGIPYTGHGTQFYDPNHFLCGHTQRKKYLVTVSHSAYSSLTIPSVTQYFYSLSDLKKGWRWVGGFRIIRKKK